MNALNEAQKNASLLEEYHELYELQRARLEKAILVLTDEREMWTKAAYSIGLKITEENNLNNTKRLNMTESSWFKLAMHFSIFLADKDTKELETVQRLADDWRTAINEVRVDVKMSEKSLESTFKHVQTILNDLKSTLATSSL